MSTKEGVEMPPWTHFYRVYCAREDGVGCVGVCDTGVSQSYVFFGVYWEWGGMGCEDKGENDEMRND